MNVFANNFSKILCSSVPSRLGFSSLTYKSAISLETLYPNSSLKLSTPTKPPNEGNEKFTGYIPLDQLQISYSRSSGPGGQNVNKVNTKVEVRFHVSSATWLTDDIRKNWAEKFHNKLSKEGYAIFRSDLTRSQQLNLADCLEKIRNSARNCVEVPKVTSLETEEKIRRRLERAARERLSIKRERSEIKSNRQAPEVL